VNHSAGLAKKDRRKIIIKPQRNKKKQTTDIQLRVENKKNTGGGKKYFGDLKMPAKDRGLLPAAR
jgi:hypothetical protein